MIIAVINSKGGVGKSTIAVHAAAWLDAHGYRTALIDGDAQCSTSDWIAGVTPGLRVERCPTAAEIADRIPRLRTLYEAVVCDGPATLSAETVMLAALADRVLMPIGPSMMDVRATYRTARLLHKIRLRSPQSPRPAVYTILNRVQPRTRLAQAAREAVHKYGFPVAATALHLRQAYADACGRRSVVWELGAAARDAACEINRLLDEVLDARALDEARRIAAAERRRPAATAGITSAKSRSAAEIAQSTPTENPQAPTRPLDRTEL